MFKIEDIPVVELVFRKCTRCKNEALPGITVCEKCKIRNAEKAKKHRENNKEKLKQYRKKHYELNKEECSVKARERRLNKLEEYNERNKRYRELNPNYASEYSKKYRKENPEKSRAQAKKYRDENKEKVKAGIVKWNKENPEKVKAKEKRFCAKHPDKIKTKGKNYRIANALKFAQYSAERRAKRKAQFVENINHNKIYERDGFICKLCGKQVDVSFKFPNPLSPSIDHIIPLSKGGLHCAENVQLAHLGCNVSKGNRDNKGVDYEPISS